MGERIGPLLDRARAIQRVQAEEQRATFRSAPVPFVPNASPPGWSETLGDEIAAEFQALMPGSDALEAAYLQQQVRGSATRREGRRLDAVTRAHERTRKELLLLAGRCADCGEPRDPKSKRFCPKHLEAMRKGTRDRETRMLSSGCAKCGVPRDPKSKRFCPKHLAARATWAKQDYAKKKQGGLVRRGVSTESGRKLRRRRKSAGICQRCPKRAMNGYSRCALHVEQHRARQAARSAAKKAATAARAKAPRAAEPGAPGSTKAVVPTRVRVRACGQRRPPAELAELTEKVAAYIATHPGVRMVGLGRDLRTPIKDLTLPVKKLLAANKIRAEGKTQGRRYFPV